MSSIPLPLCSLMTQEQPCLHALRIDVGNRLWLDVTLVLPHKARGFVLVLETKGNEVCSSVLARTLAARGFGTLTAQLLAASEQPKSEELAWHVNDLTERAAVLLEWLRHQPFLGTLPLAAVGWHTAAASLIRLAASEPPPFYALSCLEGRIDLAGAAPLLALSIPIQLLTSNATDDKPNAAAWSRLRTVKQWEHLLSFTPEGPGSNWIILTCDWIEHMLDRIEHGIDNY